MTVIISTLRRNRRIKGCALIWKKGHRQVVAINAQIWFKGHDVHRTTISWSQDRINSLITGHPFSSLNLGYKAGNVLKLFKWFTKRFGRGRDDLGHEVIQNSWNFLKEKSAENSLELMIHLIGTTNVINDIPLKCLDNVHDSKNVVINDLTSLTENNSKGRYQNVLRLSFPW